MNMKEFFNNLVDEGQLNIEKQMKLDHPWIVMSNPIGTTDVDSNVFRIFKVAFKWHQFDVAQMLCSLQDIQTWALHRHFAEQSEDVAKVAEQPILSAGQPRYMTSRKFRQLLKKHSEIELDWMGVFNHATEMQWWALLMLRSIVGAISASDRLSRDDISKADQLSPSKEDLDAWIAEANETGGSLDNLLRAKMAERLLAEEQAENEA
jgi:hypothetical protein